MAFFGVLAGAVSVVMLTSATPAKPAAAKTIAADNGGGASAPGAVPVATPAARSAPVAAALTEPAAPKWTGGLQNAWSKHPSAAYELTAENQVGLLAKRVRPVLTVRCEAGRTEVFVLTESAAVIEGDDGKHTVRVGFDAGGDQTQRWLASADYDALFAPNAVRLAQQIASSRSMRFGFAPYGAPAVVAQFDVSGFDTLIGTIAKACRWQ